MIFENGLSILCCSAIHVGHMVRQLGQAYVRCVMVSPRESRGRCSSAFVLASTNPYAEPHKAIRRAMELDAVADLVARDQLQHHAPLGPRTFQQRDDLRELDLDVDAASAFEAVVAGEAFPATERRPRAAAASRAGTHSSTRPGAAGPARRGRGRASSEPPRKGRGWAPEGAGGEPVTTPPPLAAPPHPPFGGGRVGGCQPRRGWHRGYKLARVGRGRDRGRGRGGARGERSQPRGPTRGSAEAAGQAGALWRNARGARRSVGRRGGLRDCGIHWAPTAGHPLGCLAVGALCGGV